LAIDETEKLFSSACSDLPITDAVDHDEQLKVLLFEFVSEIFCTFLEQGKSVLGSGEWVLEDDSLKAIAIVGVSFLGDLAEGAFLKFQRLAALPENKVTSKAELFVHSELVSSVLNSIRVRRKYSELISSANADAVGDDERPATNPKGVQSEIAKRAGIDYSQSTRIGDLIQLRKRGSLHQAQAALELGCGPRNIRKMVREQKLTKTGRGRILVDEKFSNEHRLRYSPK